MPQSRVRRSGAAAASQLSHWGRYSRQGPLGNMASVKMCPAEAPCYHGDMLRDIVSTSSAPRAIGPYSQAVIAQGARHIYCSGQIPLDPQTGDLVGGGDVGQETHRVMQNLAAVLKAAGVSLDAVVKTTIYLTDLKNFAAVNGVYTTYFGGTPPARATVQVTALPKDAQVEIDAVAVAD